jgi:hypothetical protein
VVGFDDAGGVSIFGIGGFEGERRTRMAWYLSGEYFPR